MENFRSTLLLEKTTSSPLCRVGSTTTSPANGGRLTNGGVATQQRRLWSARDFEASIAGSLSIDSRMMETVKPKKVIKIPSKDIAQEKYFVPFGRVFSIVIVINVHLVLKEAT
ncbi:hypothetical protein Y032_0030g2118 [Ancylostoma ceylanicum]|uniref:Uncharacterized protein n=1 Tax=Ancylostoma ceylanicum TaxID=53326 RepID=A0A016URX9_9BILA|nr:hypothetical protein Y032_0030g2118 [Ancylostoma ceylanicum]